MLRDREKSRTGWFLAVQVGRQRCEGDASGQTSRDRAEAFSELGEMSVRGCVAMEEGC